MERIADLLVFVHIEKAAGTTLVHILRKNFLFRCVYMRPLYSRDTGETRWNPTVSDDDLRLARRLFPGLRCIAGHAIGGAAFRDYGPAVRPITILRDPIERFVSQFLYSREARGREWTMEEFLDIEELHNFQVKKIAGKDDVQLAKETLDRFWLVGTTDDFDKFLVLLRAKAGPQFDINYRAQNKRVGGRQAGELLATYGDRIKERNLGDLELYNYVTRELVPRYEASYGGDLNRDVAEFQESNRANAIASWRGLADYAFRKVYVDRVLAAVRARNGLRPSGYYAEPRQKPRRGSWRDRAVAGWKRKSAR